jgi:hypothetical protein
MVARVLLFVLLLCTPLLAGCDELIEAKLCREASDKVCDKWFACWPVISVTYWGTKNECFTQMRDWCANSEEWGCDIDNDRLRDCKNNIDNSPCGALPASCSDIVNCYQSS